MEQDSDPSRPTAIGPYKILDQLGEGGMGVVYAAEQRQPIFRRVALKVIKVGMDTKEVLARFEAERQALALLDHPNIAKVLEAGATPEGRPFFAMELVRGLSITRFCDENRLSVKERLEILMQACAALQHAHERGIIHRDIKPSNLLVAEVDGKPVLKVIDFGLAKAINQRLTERTLFTEEGRIIGTPEYMSPEQAETSAQDVDGRSDVFSLGVVLYELLAGVLPFDFKAVRAKGYFEVQRCIREEEPPTPRQRLSGLKNSLEQILALRRCRLQELSGSLRNGLDAVTMKAIAKQRRDRYSSCAELADDLRRFLAGETVLARCRSGFTVVRACRRGLRKHQKLAALFIGASATAFCFLAPWLWHSAPHTWQWAEGLWESTSGNDPAFSVTPIADAPWSWQVQTGVTGAVLMAAAIKSSDGVTYYAPVRLTRNRFGEHGPIGPLVVSPGSTRVEVSLISEPPPSAEEIQFRPVSARTTDTGAPRELATFASALEEARKTIESQHGRWLTRDEWSLLLKHELMKR